LTQLVAAAAVAAACLVVLPVTRAHAFGGGGEREMPAHYYCLRGVYGAYIVSAHALSAVAPVALSTAGTDLVPAGPDGCQGTHAVAQTSSVFHNGADSTSVPVTRTTAPMNAFDLAYYLAIHDAQGVEAADAWARSQHYR
jgi:hypothetical protein